MAWDDTQISTDAITFTEWNNMVTFIKSVISESSTIKIGSGPSITEISIDGTMAGDSDTAIPTEKAVKTYVDTAVLGEDFWDRTGTDITPKTSGDTLTIDGKITIDQNSDDIGLEIDSESTSADGIYMELVEASTGRGIYCQTGTDNYVNLINAKTDSMGTNVFYRNLAAADTAGPLVNINNDGGSDDQSALSIKQDGAGDVISIDANGAGNAINIDYDGTGVPFVIHAGSSMTADKVVNIINPNAQTGIFMDQNGDGYGIDIDSEATTASKWGIRVSTGQGAGMANFVYDSTNFVQFSTPSDSEGTAYVFRDVASATSTGPVMFIEQDNAGDDQNVLSVQNDGTGNGLYIDTNGDGVSFGINSNGATTATTMNIYNDAEFTGDQLVKFRLDNASATGNVLNLTNDGTGQGLFIDQNGDGVGLYIDSEATSKNVLDINSTTVTNTIKITSTGNINANSALINLDLQGTQNDNGYGIYATDTSATGEVLALLHLDKESNSLITSLGRLSTSGVASNYFFRDLASTTTSSPVVFIEQDNASDDQDALSIQNDGTGDGIFIDQNGNGKGLYILTDATSATNFGIDVVTGSGANAAKFSQDTNNDKVELARVGTSATGTNWFYRNLTSASTAGPVVLIEQDEEGDDQAAIKIQNDGTGRSVNIDHNGASGKALAIENAGTGPAIYITSAQDVEVIDFDGCTDGGTSNTVVAGSIKVQMPNGSTGYLNVYTAA